MKDIAMVLPKTIPAWAGRWQGRFGCFGGGQTETQWLVCPKWPKVFQHKQWFPTKLLSDPGRGTSCFKFFHPKASLERRCVDKKPDL